MKRSGATIEAVQLLDLLPEHPMLTSPIAQRLLKTTAPTARRAIAALESAGILREVSGKQRDRVFAYHKYLQILMHDER
ncbi:MAG: hypothetical protein KF705_06780 [Phycisphaeraceae bacterium]|nr:hypothetical protein [Phycisphaeraceae bacterium]